MLNFGNLIDVVYRVADRLERNKRDNDELNRLKSTAIYSLARAVNVTRAYLSSRKRSGERDYVKEEEVRGAWEQVGRDMDMIGDQAAWPAWENLIQPV